MAQIKPLSDYVLLEPIETTTTSGIVLPDTAKQAKPGEGRILAVGPGAWDEDGERRIPIDGMKPGDTVIYSRYAGTEVKQDGRELTLVRAKDVLAIIA